MGLPGEQVAYALIVASYRRRMGVIAVREMARHRYRQSQFAGLTRLQLDEVGRERQVQPVRWGFLYDLVGFPIRYVS